MVQEVRVTTSVAKVLRAFLEDVDKPRYGFDLMRDTGLASGSLYPILTRLRVTGWLVAQFEEIDEKAEGRPARRFYTLSADGAAAARVSLAELQRTTPHMDTRSATNAAPTPAPFPPLDIGHTRTPTPTPLVFDPADHGHALVLARWEGGVSTMLRRLAAQAHASGVTVITFALEPNDSTAPGRMDATNPASQDETAAFLCEELEASHSAHTLAGERFPHSPVLVVVDDLESTEQSVHALIRRVLEEGAAVGVHALVGTHADPLAGWLATEYYSRFGLRLARSAPLSQVRRLIYDGQDAGLVPAPWWPGRWVARVLDEVVAITAPY